MTGQTISHYRILEKLGEGGMGEVWKAEDTRLHRTVALKFLKHEYTERFAREARAISALNHPHICTLHDIGQEDGVHFLVMEYLEGETLAARIAKGALPVAGALRHAIEIAGALQQAHRQGIVHRDLKPGNVMLTKAGAKLLDFGLAKLRPRPVPGTSETVTEPAPLTAEGAIVGTLQYMAPEQLEGREADARSDIFALGALLYEMVTGRKAFEGKSQASVISAIMNSDPPTVAVLQPASPPSLDHVVGRCLAKDPDSRWQSAGDIASELKWIAEGGPQAGIPAPLPARRLGREILGWSIASVLLIAGIVASALGWVHLRQEASPAQVVHFTIPPPEQGFAEYSPIAVSPDGRAVAFVAPLTAGRAGLWVRELSQPAARQLQELAWGSMLFWSPDSRRIGFVYGGMLMEIDLAGGSPHAISAISPPLVGGTWNRDGVILYAQVSGAPLFQVPAAGGQPRPVTRIDASREIAHWYPQFLPDQRHFLYVSRGKRADDHAIMLGSLDSRETRRLLNVDSYAVYSPAGYLLYLRGQTLMARPFDAKRFEFTGNPLTVAEQVQPFLGHAVGGAFSTSEGSVLCYQKGVFVQTQMAWHDRSGKRLALVGPPGGYTNPALSLDEKRLAVDLMDPQSNTRDIWVFDLARGTQVRLTSNSADELDALWSPDGARIAFTSTRRGPRGLYWKLSNGTGAEELLHGSPDGDSSEHWSRDGRFIFFVTPNGSEQDIWALPVSPDRAASDRKPFPVIQAPGGQGHPHLSPDGRWIAYRSMESGRSEVYVQTFPPTGGKWQISTAGGSEPSWRGDGKELFYVADNKLMSVEVRTANQTFQAGSPQALFQAPFVGAIRRNRYVATSDGRRFLILTTAANQPASLNVVLNWTAALKR